MQSTIAATVIDDIGKQMEPMYILLEFNPSGQTNNSHDVGPQEFSGRGREINLRDSSPK